MPINIAQNQIYESYTMLHPDGTVMCHCSYKKAKWYVERSLAVWLDDKIFKLNFEPQGYGKSDTAFYMQALENRCVVCGKYEELNKHHVVPYVFRSRMPVQYKENNHHDIVPVCVDCHEKYEDYATTLKAQLAIEHGANINSYMSQAQKMNKKILAARKIITQFEAGTLLDSKGNRAIIPQDRLELIKLRAAENLHPEGEIVSGAIWADKIMNNILKENKLTEFIKLWRQHFLEHMKPEFLPDHWAVDHPLESSGKCH